MLTGARHRSTVRGTGRSRLARGAALALLASSACAVITATAAAQSSPEEAATQESAIPPAGEPIVRLASKNEQLRLIERFSKVVTLPDRIARVDGFDQDVIDVTAIDSRSIRVHAKSPGVTTMTLLDEHDETYSVDVLIVGDVRHLQELLARLFPNAAIDVVEVRESVVLRGWVTQPSQITEIVEIAEQFYPRVLNQMQVGCVQQVMLKCKVMEVQRSKLRQLGVNFLYAGQGGFATSLPGAIAPIGAIRTPLGGGTAGGGGGGAAGLASIPLGAATIALGSITNGGVFSTLIDALKREQLLKILAEPNLVTMNGRPATLLSGGEIPVPIAQGLGTVSVDWRKYGTRLETVPLVLSNDRVRLEIFAEVSALDYSNASTINGVSTPGLLTRNANTQVELNFGETLIIGGLIQTTKNGTTAKIPVLGDVPYVGAAFRRVSYQDTETELVIMVTPELVAPMSPGQVPPGGPGLFTDDPTGRELFGLGMLEVPSYGDRCEGQCPPPIPTYDPHHPAGAEHIAPQAGPIYSSPPLPPATTISPTFAPPAPPTALPPEPVKTEAPPGPGAMVLPSLPPAASGPSTSSLGQPGRTAGPSANAGTTGPVTPTSYTRTAARSNSRPGLIEPTRQATR